MKRFKNILCVVERKEPCQQVLERAVSLAETNQSRLTVVCVTRRLTLGFGIPDGGPISADLQALAVKSCLQDLDGMLAPYRQRIDIQADVLMGTGFLEITRAVLRHSFDLVIKMPEPLEWLDRLLGSDDMHLLRKCPSPVWMIKSKQKPTYRRILVAVNVDNAFDKKELKARQAVNLQLVEMASSLAVADKSELHVVHCWEAEAEGLLRGPFVETSDEQVDDYVNQVKLQRRTELDKLMVQVTDPLCRDTPSNVKPRLHLVKGWARMQIPALAKEIGADLVVMGTVGRTGIPGFIMGNTAETILSQIGCSVLAIKPPGFHTPITLSD